MAIDPNTTQACTPAKRGGGFRNVPSGGYVCKIVKATRGTHEKTGRPCVKLLWDIAEGEYAGEFSADVFQREKMDFRHDAYLVESGKNGDDRDEAEKRMDGELLWKLGIISESNATPVSSFDAVYAFNLDPNLFVGRLVGFTLGEVLTTLRDGRDASKVVVVEWKTVQDIRSGRFAVPRTLDNRQPGCAQPVPAPKAYDEDIPF